MNFMNYNRIFGFGRERADIPERPPVEIIDEKERENLLSNSGQSLDLTKSLFGQGVYSQEGFAENPEAQKRLAYFFAKKLGLKKGDAVFDVGFGVNTYIMDGFQELGVEASGIELTKTGVRKHEDQWHAPAKEETTSAGAALYSGDIAELDSTESELRNRKFNLVLFNGSWTSSGNNWTVGGEVLEGKFHTQKPGTKGKNKTLSEFMDRAKTDILGKCVKALAPDGKIGFVSSRYAFHGAGYSFGRLPDEKLDFLELARRMEALGAKKLRVIGLSAEGWRELLEKSWKASEDSLASLAGPAEGRYTPTLLEEAQVEEVSAQLQDAARLKPENLYTEFGDPESIGWQKVYNRQTLEYAKSRPEFGNVARIDALVAEF